MVTHIHMQTHTFLYTVQGDILNHDEPYTYMHIHAHTHTHSLTHSHAQKHKHTHTHTHTHTHSLTHTHPYILTYIAGRRNHAWPHEFIRGIYIFSFIHLRSLSHTHTRTHTRTQTHIYIYVHTNIQCEEIYWITPGHAGPQTSRYPAARNYSTSSTQPAEFLKSQLACQSTTMGWLRLVGSLKLSVSFAKEPYKRDYFLQKRPAILRSLLTVATPYVKSL